MLHNPTWEYQFDRIGFVKWLGEQSGSYTYKDRYNCAVAQYRASIGEPGLSLIPYEKESGIYDIVRPQSFWEQFTGRVSFKTAYQRGLKELSQ